MLYEAFSTLALTVSEMITFQMFEFENLDLVQGLQKFTTIPFDGESQRLENS